MYTQRGEEPEALKNKPVLPDYLVMYIEAFSLLSAQRGISAEGLSPIALSEILVYASEYEIYDRHIFVRHMCALDRVYRKFYADREKAKKPNG